MKDENKIKDDEIKKLFKERAKVLLQRLVEKLKIQKKG